MMVLGLNRILEWCHVWSNGRRYTCQTKEINGELFFYFNKGWHSVTKFISEHAEELVEEGGRVISRPVKL